MQGVANNMRGPMRNMQRPGSARRMGLGGPQGRMMSARLHQGPLGGKMGPRQGRGMGGRRNLESPMRPGSQAGFSFGGRPNTPPRMRQLRGTGMRPTSAKPWKRAQKQNMLGRKNPKRATVVSQPILVQGRPGETVIANVTLHNGGFRPMREGFHVTSCYTLDEVKTVFDDIRVPLEKIKPKTNFSVKVPIKIKESAKDLVK